MPVLCCLSFMVQNLRCAQLFGTCALTRAGITVLSPSEHPHCCNGLMLGGCGLPQPHSCSRWAQAVPLPWAGAL